MKPCEDRQQSLLLDIYDELTPGERAAWERHLEVCEGCRQERNRLMELLEGVRAAMPSPTLSPEKARAMTRAITERLRGTKEQRWWERRWVWFPNRLVPALAALCLVVAAFVWFSVRDQQRPSALREARVPGSEPQILAQDLDIIKNLELLEEMDVLEKLVRVVDEKNTL